MCMERLQVIYDGLQQYKPGEIEQEPPEIQQGYKGEVSSEALTTSLFSVSVKATTHLEVCTCYGYL